MVVKDCNFVTMKQLLLLLLLTMPLLFRAQAVTIPGHCYLRGKKPAVGATIQLKVVDNRSVQIPSTTISDHKGYYSFGHLKVGDLLEIQYEFEGVTLSLNTIITNSNDLQELPDQLFYVQENRGVVVRQDGQNPFEIEKLPQLNLKGIVGLEKTRTLTTAATANNGLTAN